MVSFVRVGEVCGREEEDICSKGPGIAWLVHNMSSAFYSSRVTNYIHTNIHTPNRMQHLLTIRNYFKCFCFLF